MKEYKRNKNSINISEILNSLFSDRVLLCISFIYILFSISSQYAAGNGFANKFCLNQFYMNYVDYGFVQRGLIGTLIRLTFGYYIPLETMQKVVFFIYNIAAIALLLLFYKLKKNSFIPAYRSFMFRPVFLLAILKIFPSIISQHQGRLDVYLALCGLLCVLLLVRNRFVFCVPVICALAMMIHPVFAFIVFPVVFITMLIKTFIVCDTGYSVSGLAVMLISSFLIIALLYYFSNVGYYLIPVDYSEAKSIFVDRAGETAVDNSFWNENNLFFRTDNTISLREYSYYFNDQIRKTQISSTLYKAVCFSPFILVYFYIYAKWSKTFCNKIKRNVCFLLPFSVLVILPLYVFEVDYGRWNMYALFMIMCGLLLPDLTVYNQEESPYYKMPVRFEYIMSILAIAASLITDYFYVSS